MHLLPENIVNLSAVTMDRVDLPRINNHSVTLQVLRTDKIDNVITGNKWFKLQFYLEEALERGQRQLVTFGGAYSNHILATACVAAKAGLASTGIIRGERPATLSHTLVAAARWGMQLHFVNREEYNRTKDPAFIPRLLSLYNEPCIIPEGGAGGKGIAGAAQMLKLAGDQHYTHIVCAVGTGTMLCGLAAASSPGQQVVGIPVLKGFDHWLPAGIDERAAAKITIIPGYHFGGYAKKSAALFDFMNSWYAATGIPTDFVYTGKLFFAVNDLMQSGYFPGNSRLLVIHSGGLQGNQSLPPKTLLF